VSMGRESQSLKHCPRVSQRHRRFEGPLKTSQGSGSNRITQKCPTLSAAKQCKDCDYACAFRQMQEDLPHTFEWRRPQDTAEGVL